MPLRRPEHLIPQFVAQRALGLLNERARIEPFLQCCDLSSRARPALVRPICGKSDDAADRAGVQHGLWQPGLPGANQVDRPSLSEHAGHTPQIRAEWQIIIDHSGYPVANVQIRITIIILLPALRDAGMARAGWIVDQAVANASGSGAALSLIGDLGISGRVLVGIVAVYRQAAAQPPLEHDLHSVVVGYSGAFPLKEGDAVQGRIRQRTAAIAVLIEVRPRSQMPSQVPDIADEENVFGQFFLQLNAELLNPLER